jgi:nucleoid-associated protein YgaU
VRLPLEQKVPPAAPGPVQAVAVPPAPAAPRQPQVIVRERVRVVYVVVPPPDFSDPFVHIRGTNFDPRVLAAGGPFPTRTIVQPVRVVTRPAPSAQPAPQPARTYIVRTGDTLTGIALRFYGNSELWTTIFNANRRVVGSDPNEVIPGTRLVIP